VTAVAALGMELGGVDPAKARAFVERTFAPRHRRFPEDSTPS
jgi:hypothetical protein